MKLKNWIIGALILLCNFFSAQVDTIKKDRIYINCSLILNKAYSQFEEFTGSFGQSGYYERIRPLGNPQLLKPGFYLSINKIAGKKTIRKFVYGAAFSITQNQYKHIIHSPENQSSGWYEGKYTDRDVDVRETIYLMSAEIGIRRKLSEKFYLGNFLILHAHLLTVGSERGNSVTTTYTNYPAGNPYVYLNNTQTEVAPINTVSKNSLMGESLLDASAGAGVSYRPTLCYRFVTGKRCYDVTVFRNFSFRMRYSRPWWGLGLSYFI